MLLNRGMLILGRQRDERPPQCSNCVRRQITCDYAPRVVSRISPGGQPSSTTSPVSTTTPSSLPPTSPSVPSPGNGTLDLADLELLHHYTTSTYKTLPSRAAPDQRELWQIQVVQLGLEHEFLLRGILAVPTLHLAYLLPMRRESLTLHATTHQSVALRLFHEALDRVNTSNCVALEGDSGLVPHGARLQFRPAGAMGDGIPQFSCAPTEKGDDA